jgi:hypothetical protein
LPGLVLGFALAVLVWGVLQVLPERFYPTGDDPVTTMVGGILLVFAFVLGLTVSQETSTLAAAEAAAATEANSVGELYWYAHALSEPEHSRLQGLLRSYVTVVVRQEWPLLGQHKSSEQASAAVRAIREDILVFQPVMPVEKAVYSDELTQVSSLFTARRARLDAATAGGVPLILIQGLIVLVGLILLAIPCSGSLKGARRILLYGVFGAFLIAALFLIVDLNNPFSGTVAVHPTSFNILFNGTFLHVT